MITSRPGFKPLHDAESPPAKASEPKEATLPSVQEAIARAAAREALLRAQLGTQVIGNPNPSPPLRESASPVQNPVLTVFRRAPGAKQP